MEFTLTATNLNSNREHVMHGIQDQHYKFDMEDKPCALYSFHVIAETPAGSSAVSETVTANIPSLPDISLSESNLTHSLVNTPDGVQLKVKLQVS